MKKPTLVSPNPLPTASLRGGGLLVERFSHAVRAKIALKSFSLPPFRQGSYATREGGRGLGALLPGVAINVTLR